MQDNLDKISENIRSIKARISAAASRSGRRAEEITLVAVSKNVSLEMMRSAIRAGIQAFAENRIQEAKQKFQQLGPTVGWHMIGHLQTNKARIAAAIFDLIQSVDSVRIADALEAEAHRLDRELDVLIEVNIGLEESKFGVAPSEIEPLILHIESLQHLRLCGLMSMAPYVENPELVRPLFKEMKVWFERFRAGRKYPDQWRVLSMGMTNDFEIAVEEGATLLRIGTGIFTTR